MDNNRIKIAIGIITYKRPKGLEIAINSLLKQKFNKNLKPELSIIIVDNDENESAFSIVNKISKNTKINIIYAVEYNRGIPYARNKVVELSKSNNLLAFIDDDEYAENNWLDELLYVKKKYNADIVSGPVYPIFNNTTYHWLKKENFHDRRRYHNGEMIESAATNNVLFSIHILKSFFPPFDVNFGLNGGDDTFFFKKIKSYNYKIIWAEFAIVNENIPDSRVSYRWLLRRSYRIGNSLAFMDRYFEPSLYKYFIRLLKINYRIIGGVLIFIPSVCFFYKKYILISLQFLFKGFGMISGLFGVLYKEYKFIHGS